MFDPHHYPVVLYWSADDQAFIVEVPDLPGCMADGATQEEALANGLLIIQEWLDFAKELGREIPAPRARLQIAA
ncbi:type II toxin-antitoxin system HicB family antitoxin [Hymenobacter sp. BT664]|uniref:Type II toxin-antitoxin system HicB family antitoxin n=1 Tax=Hymenobacter montanus TaxID=2771359 RepID=A0A927BBS0_9BACT|nr:type II toxin-antitoxin system HicB family antitoxin [Hymenobacter montanus]MBD2767855.1 type II toxin-antitoxin system HicB family antitoxin [Hymenobacter montanus]